MLLELARLLRGGDLRLGRLTQQFVGALKMPRFNFRLGLFDERFRSRVVRVQGRDLRLQSLVVVGNAIQRLGKPL